MKIAELKEDYVELEESQLDSNKLYRAIIKASNDLHTFHLVDDGLMDLYRNGELTAQEYDYIIADYKARDEY